MNVSFVIPAYNEADNIGILVREIIANPLFADNQEVQYEIIVVDDASRDDTYDQVLALSLPTVKVMRLSRRSGSHVAIRAGLGKCAGDAIICLAADGQDDPAAIVRMIQKWHDGHDIVWALRKKRENEPLLYKLFTLGFYRLLKFFAGTDSKIDLSKADFYLLDKKVVQAINSCHERNTSLFGLIVWLGYKQGHVEYDRRERKSGRSKWNFQSRLELAKDWIIAFSGIPLKLLTLVGFAIALLGFIYAAIVVGHNLILGNPVPGWSSVMTAILVLGGGQIMMLGIIGEYLWRTLDESRDRPLVFIEKQYGFSSNE